MQHETQKSHPSYGLIQLNRQQGGQNNLFRSPVKHQHRMTLTIAEAEVMSDEFDEGGNARPRRQIIEVALSGIQFAELLTQPGIGEGVPCTIIRRDGRLVEAPPAETDGLDEQADHGAERLLEEVGGRLDDAIEKLEGALASGSVRKGDVKAALNHLRVARDAKLRPGVEFYRKRLREKAETLRSKVAAEVTAVGELFLRNLGAEALAEKVRGQLPKMEDRGQPKPESLPDGE